MKNHPSEELLKAYADGSIDACNGLTLAAHLETCEHCHSKVDELESQASQIMMEPDAEIDIEQSMMDEIFNNIVCLSKDKTSLNTQKPSVKIEVNGKSFVLPKSLRGVSKRLSEWKSYGGKVYTAHLDLGEEERVSLLYIAGGVQVPQHTHKGVETTLVLHGSFSDEEGYYSEGDYIVADGSIKHSPRTEEGQDCLCLTVLSEPMVFTQGVARVFNIFGKGMYP
ncbi:putative anti-sigma factor [Vibrio halioticoli NBRC 102217]|uniref:Putative anti-sigma factor n=1 Tax=Vibrio halioticoli NBRC 102217 TaxID=1219072 RepID=V5FGG0_9VIBR|nr:ChrR family anti-sigma-E factor [Vibrio halioticoli]GAD90833.1 putative anti-sigma factor [Vibrio halioticoli NBRC 102217]